MTTIIEDLEKVLKKRQKENRKFLKQKISHFLGRRVRLKEIQPIEDEYGHSHFAFKDYIWKAERTAGVYVIDSYASAWKHIVDIQDLLFVLAKEKIDHEL